MVRELVITIDETIYRQLHEQIGREDISRFIEDPVRPFLDQPEDLEAGYREMAGDAQRERDAAE